MLSAYLVFASQFASAQGVVDSDNDTLSDFDESIWGTDPLNPDTDSDGLKDGEEVYVYGTNPLVVDTDSDGLRDGLELLFYKTNPTMESTDGDRYDDGQEILGTSPTGLGDMGGVMPAYVVPPGDNVFVAAYPIIDIDVDDDIYVVLNQEITTEFRNITMYTQEYSVSNTQGNAITVGSEKTHVLNGWVDIANSTADAVSHNSHTEDVTSTDEEYFNVKTFGFSVESQSSNISYNESEWGWGVNGKVDLSLGIGKEENVGDAIKTVVKKVASKGVEIGGEYHQNHVSRDEISSTTKNSLEQSDYEETYTGTTTKHAEGEENGREYIVGGTVTRGSGTESGFSSSMAKTSYQETTVTNTNSIASGYEWATAVMVNPSNAGTLRFTFFINNKGTDIAREIDDLRFNVFIGNRPPLTCPELGSSGISFHNLNPGASVQQTCEVSITLDEMRDIDMGIPARIRISGYSYGADQLFYENALGGSVMVEIDDGVEDGDESVDFYMTYSGINEKYLDVMKRLNSSVQIKNPATKRIEVQLKTDGNSVVTSLLGKNVTEWSWWKVLLQNPAEESFSDMDSVKKTRMLFIYDQDADHDYYTDRTEGKIGTDESDPDSHPSPVLAVASFEERNDSFVGVSLKFSNTGNYGAYGVEARLISVDDSIIIYDNLIGGGGSVDAGKTLMPADYFVYENLTDNYQEPIIIVLYNDPQGPHFFLTELEIKSKDEDISGKAGDMLSFPEMSIRTNDQYGFSQDNWAIADYLNPSEKTIEGAKVYFEVINSSGYLKYIDNMTVDIKPGSNSFLFWWNPSEWINKSMAGEGYKILMTIADGQNALIEDDVRRMRIVDWEVYPKLINTFDDDSSEKILLFDGSDDDVKVYIDIPKNSDIISGEITMKSSLSKNSDITIDFDDDGSYDVEIPNNFTVYTFSNISEVNGSESIKITYKEPSVQDVTFEFIEDPTLNMESVEMEITGYKVNHYSVTRDFFNENSASNNVQFGHRRCSDSCMQCQDLNPTEYSDSGYGAIWTPDEIGTLAGGNPWTYSLNEVCIQQFFGFYTPEENVDIDNLTFSWRGYVTSDQSGGELSILYIWVGGWSVISSHKGNGWKTMSTTIEMSPNLLYQNYIWFRASYFDEPIDGEYSYILTDYVNLTLNMKSYAENLSIDIWNDNENDHFIEKKFNESNSPMSIYLNVSEIQKHSSPSILGVRSETAGKIEVNAVNITYSTLKSEGAIPVDIGTLEKYLEDCAADVSGTCKVPMTFSVDSTGDVRLSDMRIFYNMEKIVGDVNGDCKVGLMDLVIVGKTYGAVVSDTKWDPRADLNSDGHIGIVDLATVGRNYGKSC